MEKFLEPFDASRRVLIALLFGTAAYFIGWKLHEPLFRAITAWNVFAFTSIILAWLRIIFSDAKTAVLTAKLQDSHRVLIFAFCLLGICASFVAVAVLLGTAKGLSPLHLREHVGVAAITVICSWFLTNTIFALHYAHAFYREPDPDDDCKPGAGLNFPETEEPEFMDFAYFSFVIGMTFQVSDVAITTARIRRLALVHGVLSFGFTTVILALAINIGSGLIGGG
jgi:uncharacterized membrane protein